MKSVALLLIGGCSFAMARAPDRDPGVRPAPCSSSIAAPVADTFGAIGFVLVGVASALMPAVFDNSQESQGYRNIGLVISAIGVAGYATAAVTGFHSVDRCDRYNGDASTR